MLAAWSCCGVGRFRAMTSPIAAAGLVLDIGGAFLLALAFMFKMPASISLETATVYNGNTIALMSLAKQKAEAEVAAVLVGMLLCLSSCCWWALEESVEPAGEVALEAAGRFAAALTFADSAFDVVDGRSVDSASREDDLVQGAVELPVATAVESVADRLARRGGNRGGAGEPGEGGFADEAAWV
jgi:hypothetical protein